MARSSDHGVPPIPLSYISLSRYTPYTPATTGATLPVSDFVFNDHDDRQDYTSSLSQKMVHQHTSRDPRLVYATTGDQPYMGPGDIYNQVPTQKTRVPSAVHSVSDFSHDCQLFCINAHTVPNGATTLYNDHSNFVILHHFPLSPSSSAGRQQQHTIPIPPLRLGNNDGKFFPMVYRDGSRSPNHDPGNYSLTGSPPALEVASSAIFPQRRPSTANTDHVLEHDLDVAWQPAEQMYASLHMNLSPDTETALVSPHIQPPSPRPHSNASHPAVSTSPSGSAGVFTPGRSRQLQDVAPAESMSFPEVQRSIETSPATSGQITNATTAEEPNFCHLCRVSFTQRQVFRRHLKDKHEDKESCLHCSSFKWSRGRPHLYRKHLELKHPQFTPSEDRPTRRTRKHRAIGARQRKVPNGRTQSTSGGLVANVS
ncbi:hypothetical protein EDB86DRAFT_1070229 [Lactarius hatsudake]|nr:hypothetical protein EDB86DRAFT_1070229 [Lactarius hatsudake]